MIQNSLFSLFCFIKMVARKYYFSFDRIGWNGSFTASRQFIP